MYGHPAATYESCSTSAFKHGRTETIRSCTIEAQAAAKAIVAGNELINSSVIVKFSRDFYRYSIVLKCLQPASTLKRF